MKHYNGEPLGSGSAKGPGYRLEFRRGTDKRGHRRPIHSRVTDTPIGAKRLRNRRRNKAARAARRTNRG